MHQKADRGSIPPQLGMHARTGSNVKRADNSQAPKETNLVEPQIRTDLRKQTSDIQYHETCSSRIWIRRCGFCVIFMGIACAYVMYYCAYYDWVDKKMDVEHAFKSRFENEAWWGTGAFGAAKPFDKSGIIGTGYRSKEAMYINITQVATADLELKLKLVKSQLTKQLEDAKTKTLHNLQHQRRMFKEEVSVMDVINAAWMRKPADFWQDKEATYGEEAKIALQRTFTLAKVSTGLLGTGGALVAVSAVPCVMECCYSAK